MNHYYITICLCMSGIAQLHLPNFLAQEKKPKEIKSIIWSNDFSNESEWLLSNETNDNQNWEITDKDSPTIGYDTGGWEDITNSISNENGYALYDSDALGANGGQNATITYFQAIDLSSFTNVVLRFQQRGKLLNDTQNFVEISTDSVNWTSYQVNSDKIISIGFEEIEQINITSIAANQSTIYLRFRFIGAWDYAWMIDDVQIIEQPQNDIVSLKFGIIGENNEEISYGSTPIDQLDQVYVASGSVYNFGLQAQDSINMSGQFVNSNYTIPFSVNYNAVIQSDDTLFLAAPFELNQPILGVYEGNYTFMSSGEDTSSTEFYNNSGLQNFELTEMLYAQDFMNVSNTINATPVGTEDYGHPSDTYFATLYHFRAGTNIISGFQIPLHPDSEIGGEMEIAIIDTASFLSSDLTPYVDLNNNVALSTVAQIGSAEINSGEIIIGFDSPIILPDGAFYAVVRPMNPGNSPIYLYDDLTVEQPSYASMVTTLELGLPAVNEDGNSFAIRLLMGDQANVPMVSSVDKLNLFPNPANESFHLTIENTSSNCTILLTDATGKTVWEKTNVIDSTKKTYCIESKTLASGFYTVHVKTTQGNTSKIMVVQH